MTTPLYKPLPKNATGAKPPLASDIGQIVDALNGAIDIGQITLAQPIQVASTTGITAAATAGTGLGIGTYLYKLTYATGVIQGDNTAIPGGETPGSASISVTTTSGNQQVTLSGLPAVSSWPSTAIGINIYRTAVGGADGTQKLVGTIYTNYARTAGQATFVDSVTDANLGRVIPAVNTTGTSVYLPALGTQNSQVTMNQVYALGSDTRKTNLTYANGQLTQIQEVDPTNGNAVVATITLTYTNGQLSSVSETAGGHTSTTTLNYSNGQLASITKTYS